jgi:hypothetical protein
MSKRGAIESNHGNIVAQVAVVDEQVATLKKEKERVEKLIASVLQLESS